MICGGIDVGSRAIKVVILDTDRSQILSTAIADQGVDQRRLTRDLFKHALDSARLERDRLSAVVATGYGRNVVDFANTTITEITCHARGVHHVVPDARTVIEIGGQDSKVIHLENGGRVRDFSMNDRCAAGTGRFLEMLAARLEVDLKQLGELSRESRNPAAVSNTCVVFAETEIIGLLAEGTPVADVIAGVQIALATRVAGLLGRAVVRPVCLTGGVALQPGMAHALAESLACTLCVAPNPQFTGALGAALLAGERVVD